MLPISESHRRSQLRLLQRCAAVAAIAVFSLALSGCGDQSVSGEYVASHPTEVDRMQLVETPDKHVTGQLEISLLKPDGSITYENFAITGATDDTNVSLTLKPPVPLSSAVEVSGALAWGKLTLTGGSFGGQSSTFALVRADEAQYQTALNALRSQAAQTLRIHAVAQEKASEMAAQEKKESEERNIAQQIDQLSDRMEKFEQAATAYLQKFPAVASHYRDITSKMEGYLASERSLAGDQNAFSTRNDLSLTIGQGTLATYQLHDQVEQVRLNFEGNIMPLTKETEAAKNNCGNLETQGGVLQTACQRFLNVLPAYSKKYDDVAAGLADLEATYQSEVQKQRDLQLASQRIIN